MDSSIFAFSSGSILINSITLFCRYGRADIILYHENGRKAADYEMVTVLPIVIAYGTDAGEIHSLQTYKPPKGSRDDCTDGELTMPQVMSSSHNRRPLRRVKSTLSPDLQTRLTPTWWDGFANLVQVVCGRHHFISAFHELQPTPITILRVATQMRIIAAGSQ